MFDLSFTEMILAGVVALVILGPERLPVVARKIGEWVGKIQSLAAGVKNELNQQAQLTKLTKVKQDLQAFGQQIEQHSHDIAQNIAPAWERLPDLKTPADFGVHEEEQTPQPSSLPTWFNPSLRKQAMIRKRQHRNISKRTTPKLRSRP